MTCLLDVSAVLALLLDVHPEHRKVNRWAAGKTLAVCPITEIGFLRISTNPKAYNFSMADAKKLLSDLWNHSVFLSADLSATRIAPQQSSSVTDTYLAELAQRHNMKLATLDTSINHPAVEVLT